MPSTIYRPSSDVSATWQGNTPAWDALDDPVEYPSGDPETGGYRYANKGDSGDVEVLGMPTNKMGIGKVRNATMYSAGRREAGAADVNQSFYLGAWEANSACGFTTGTPAAWGTPKSVDYARGAGKAKAQANAMQIRFVAPTIIGFGVVYTTVGYVKLTHTRWRKVMGVQDPYQVMQVQDMNIKTVMFK